jgi:hypothetical protein
MHEYLNEQSELVKRNEQNKPYAEINIALHHSQLDFETKYFIINK